MIAVTIWKDEVKERLWLKEFAGDKEELGASQIERLFEWKENDLPGGNRILIDRLKKL